MLNPYLRIATSTILQISYPFRQTTWEIAQKKADLSPGQAEEVVGMYARRAYSTL